MIALSIALNIIFLLLVFYLIFNGKNLIKHIVFKFIIEKRHYQKLSMFKKCEASNGAIIFLGDSITEGGNWEELFKDKLVLNRGIGGDTTEGVLHRLDEITRHLPSKLFICIGTNDIAKNISLAKILENYKAILLELKNKLPDSIIYVQSLFPVGEKIMLGHNNKDVLAVNSALQTLSKEQNIVYIDLHRHFCNENGFLKADFTNDDLHLMGNAYLLWKEKIMKYIS